MGRPKLIILASFIALLFQSCGINNYFKAKKIREEIVSENRKTENLIKRRDAEFAKMQSLKDSVRNYQLKLKVYNP